MIRRFLVQHFALGTWTTVFGVTFHSLRAPRILFPLMTFTALFVMGSDPSDWSLGIWDYIALANLAFWFWIGGGWFSFNYFRIWPATIDELDTEQVYDYLRGIEAGVVKNPEGGYGPLSMTEAQKEWLKDSELWVSRRHLTRFSNLSNLLGLGLSITAIILYYVFV